LDQVTAKESWLTPIFTTDTHILILKADKAIWIQIGDAMSGATVVQYLPSGNIGDLSGAQSTTIERVWAFGRMGDEINIVQIGKALFLIMHWYHVSLDYSVLYTRMSLRFQDALMYVIDISTCN